MTEEEHGVALKNGAMLHEYRLEGVLGVGGFGVTYLAEDTHLQKKVVIKEFLPNEIAIRQEGITVLPKSSSDKEGFEWGLDRFLQEAQVLARFNHPNIVKVSRFFKENGTAYFVMDYEEGEDLDLYIKRRGGTLQEDEIKQIILPILDGLREVHSHDFLHRDIKPGNIYIRKNGSPMLIDFGASRYALSSKSKSLTQMLTPGYAPIEQYSSDASSQGPYTDIYAIGAVMYKMISAQTPAEAQDRSNAVLEEDKDPYSPIQEIAQGSYSKAIFTAIDTCLMLRRKQRPQSVKELQKLMMEGSQAPTPPPEDKPKDEKPQEEPAQPEAVEQEVEATPKEEKRNNKGIKIAIAAVIAVLVSVFIFVMIGTKTPPKEVVGLQATTQEIKLISLSWQANSEKGIDFYNVHRSSSQKGDYILLVQLKQTAFKDHINEDGKNYYYKVTAVDKDGLESSKQTTPVRGSTLTKKAQEKLAEEKRQKVEAAKYRTVTIRSNVSNDSVYVNGVNKGATPVKVRKKIGQTLNIEVKKEGYVSAKRKVKVKTNQTVKLHLAAVVVEPDPVDIEPEETGGNEEFKRLLRSAKNGNIIDQYWIGRRYEDGDGIEQDYAKTMYWFRRSSEEGNKISTFSVGMLYEYGTGVEENHEKAVEWYRKSAEEGYDYAKEKLRDLGYEY